MPLNRYSYTWPHNDGVSDNWHAEGDFMVRLMPESPAELQADSRWPAFFPSPMCVVTTRSGSQTALEKVVGASIVNRFPYVMALSFCRKDLSQRHHTRHTFMEILERDGQATVQFLPPGETLDRCMTTIQNTEESTTMRRVTRTVLSAREGVSNKAPIFDSAYLAYEARLVKPARDFDGVPIYQQPWLDVGSHRVYFLEINAIQLRQDIARGQAQIQWRSLPDWSPKVVHGSGVVKFQEEQGGYRKGFTADYAFPSKETIAFEADEFARGMAIKHLPPLPQDQVEVDNDRARWPCFFPSSVGMITCFAPDGTPNLMPCGSTTILSRSPLTVAIAVSYAAINARYAPRTTLEMIRRTGRFGCGVPYRGANVLEAIRYAGNHSFERDHDKVRHSGLTVDSTYLTPRLRELPIHFDCRVVREVRLGTHVLFLGEVKRISKRRDVSVNNPIRWCPWASVPTEQSLRASA